MAVIRVPLQLDENDQVILDVFYVVVLNLHGCNLTHVHGLIVYGHHVVVDPFGPQAHRVLGVLIIILKESEGLAQASIW